MTQLKTLIFNEVKIKNAKAADMSHDELDNLLFYSPSGLRLTFKGFLILKNIFTVYSFEMDMALTARHQIGMGKMTYPYYVTSKRLILFSEMDAMVIKIHGGIKGFLETCYNMDRE
jgi:hypothetical protein